MHRLDEYIRERENSKSRKATTELLDTSLPNSIKEGSIEYLIRSAFKPLTFIFEKVGNVLESTIANLEVNRTESLQKSIENWKRNPQYVSKDLAELRARNRELEEKQQHFDSILAEKQLELQQIKVKCIYGVDIFGRF